jgi:hypothetical protein
MDFEDRLRSALGDIELTEREERYLKWLARMDQETVETFAGLFEKCRGGSRSEEGCKMYSKEWSDGRREYRYGPEWVAAQLMAEGGFLTKEEARAAWRKGYD